MEQREKMKPKLVPEHEGTYINMQRLIQVQGEHVVTGVPARYVMGLIKELNAAEQRERVLREAATAAGRLADAMETCHECKGTVLVDEQPTHCEDCSWDCESHGGSECPTLYGLHRELKRKLAALATPAPEQPAAKPWGFSGYLEVLPDTAAERIAVQQERITALEGMLAENKRVLELAMSTVARLSAPVSDAEWLDLCAGDALQITDVQRHELDRFIAARATPPAKEQP